MKRFLLLFSYVRDLEYELDKANQALSSANRYINALEGIKATYEERIEGLKAENKELMHHLSGGPS